MFCKRKIDRYQRQNRSATLLLACYMYVDYITSAVFAASSFFSLAMLVSFIASVLTSYDPSLCGDISGEWTSGWASTCSVSQFAGREH
eukprot:m.44486 g.44486  ORF g.44486 m.44486 type:complete len:88 (+) comp19687_c0_seq2:79-342(+)